MTAVLGPNTKTARVRGTFGRKALTLHYGGEYIDAGEILLDEPRHGHYDGIALRDALLEAFPLPEAAPTPSGAAERLADWEKELLAGAEKKPDVVPGMVLRERGFSDFVVLPDNKVRSQKTGRVLKYFPATDLIADPERFTVVFDPRDAKALPNPLGIRVGDRVERTRHGVTISFEVGHIDGTTGYLSSKGSEPGVTYNPRGFTVTSREVPDRLPAGTITRSKRDPEALFLRTRDGHIFLTGSPTLAGKVTRNDAPGMDTDVQRGATEVIYLPES